MALRLGMIALTGIIIFASSAAQASLSVTPASVYFPNTRVGTGGMQMYASVQNYSSRSIRSVSVNSMCGASDISVRHDCFFELRPGGSCTVTFSFYPYRTRVHTCNVQINGSDGSSAMIFARGEAVAYGN